MNRTLEHLRLMPLGAQLTFIETALRRAQAYVKHPIANTNKGETLAEINTALDLMPTTKTIAQNREAILARVEP